MNNATMWMRGENTIIKIWERDPERDVDPDGTTYHRAVRLCRGCNMDNPFKIHTIHYNGYITELQKNKFRKLE